MTKKKILILGAGGMQVPIIRKANELGYETIVVDYDPSAPGFDVAGKKYETSTLDIEGVLKISQDENIDAILTTSDAPVKVVAYVADKLGLTAMSMKVSEICTNKFLQRELLKERNVNCPEFHLVDESDKLDGFRKFPYVVKPIDSSASRGVKKVNTREDLQIAIKDAIRYSRSGKAIVESYIVGREFSVESFTQDGVTHIVAITEKETCGEDEGFFVEKRHIEPARINYIERGLIEEAVKSVASIIGLNNCPSHMELKINDEGAFVIEVACRLGGDYITSDLVPLSTGVDMLENLIDISLGNKINLKPKYSKSSCVQFLTPSNYYKCADFIGSKDKSIIRYELQPFEERVIRNSMDRLGYVIIQTTNNEELEPIIKGLE